MTHMANASAERRPPQVEDIEVGIDRVIRAFVGLWKFFLVMLILAGIVWLVVLPMMGLAGMLQGILVVASLLFQLLFAILFMIIQFVALFMFLARPRIYWIMPGETGVGFKDYRGNPEVLEAASRVVTLLRGVKQFKEMGGELTRGILLLGPPGTGKSYLAQCISTEAGVPFGYLSAPSLQSMFMGVSNLTVMRLYGKARKLSEKYGACILFIDEIDAIGGSRGGGMPMGMMGGMMGMGGGSGLLNELLIQMDPPPSDRNWRQRLLRKFGIRKEKAKLPPVLTMAATNLAEVLDKALLRPGRFDRKIVVDPPDFDGRKEVIEYYLAKVAHDDFELDRLAYDTIGYSPAAIKFVINEAVINAHFNGRTQFSYDDWLLALENHELGLRHPIKNMSHEDKRRLAYHEAGHAVAQALLLPKAKVHKVTIIRHGTALGLSQAKPVQEQYTDSKEEILADIQTALASRAAEELFLNIQLNGVTSDLQQATQMAYACLNIFGMNGTLVSTLGLQAFGGGAGINSVQEIDKLLREQFIRVKQLLHQNADFVVAVAETLLAKLELNADEIDEIIAEVQRRRLSGQPLPTMPPVDAPARDPRLLEAAHDRANGHRGAKAKEKLEEETAEVEGVAVPSPRYEAQ
jgi:ATP-dependent Zn protease